MRPKLMIITKPVATPDGVRHGLVTKQVLLPVDLNRNNYCVTFSCSRQKCQGFCRFAVRYRITLIAENYGKDN